MSWLALSGPVAQLESLKSWTAPAGLGLRVTSTFPGTGETGDAVEFISRVCSRIPALQVPALAVTRQSGQTFVLAVVEKDGKTIVSRKPVKLGALGPQAYVVEGGLEAGDRIAVSSIQALRDGSAVKPKAPAAAAPVQDARRN